MSSLLDFFGSEVSSFVRSNDVYETVVMNKALVNSQMGVGENIVSSEGKSMFYMFISVGTNYSERGLI